MIMMVMINFYDGEWWRFFVDDWIKMLYDNNMENITHQVKSCSRNILLSFVFWNTICFGK